MSENVKTEIKTINGLPGSVGRFVRPRDGQLIWVYPRKNKGESSDAAIKRVMKANGAEGGTYERCA